MGRLLLRWILLACSLIIVSLILTAVSLPFEVPHKTAGDFLRLLVGVAILSLVNVTLGKLLKILTIPLNCLTLGLCSLAINALMLLLVAHLKIGFSIGGTGVEEFL